MTSRIVTALISPAPEPREPGHANVGAAVRHWNPETQLLGALLWVTAARAHPILEVVHDDDVEAPVTRWALELVRGVVAEGHDPNPVVVARRAEKRPPPNDPTVKDPPNGAAGGRARPYHRLTLHLHDAYHHAVGYGAGVEHHARAVLDDSFRRAVRRHGIRMQRLAEAMADREDLTGYVTDVMRGDLRDIWVRTRALDQLATT